MRGPRIVWIALIGVICVLVGVLAVRKRTHERKAEDHRETPDYREMSREVRDEATRVGHEL
jgi:hypothetical protein